MLSSELAAAACPITCVFWMGSTPGVLDADQRTIDAITSDNIDSVLALAAGAAGTDVTGGMRHRVETAWRLAGERIPSVILDGLEGGALERALLGQSTGGTRVDPHS